MIIDLLNMYRIYTLRNYKQLIPNKYKIHSNIVEKINKFNSKQFTCIF